MSDAGEKKIPEGIRNELEHSEVPLAVYRFVDGHIQTILVSDGFIRWQAPGCTREDLLKFLDTDMYRDVHREDIVFVATKAKEFAKSKDGRYEVVYRQKLYGKDEYRTLHAQGYHRILDDGSECAIVVYDDVTSAFDTCKDFRNEFDNSLIEFLNNDSLNTASNVAPSVNVKENECGYEVELAAPGVKKEYCRVHVDEDHNLCVAIENKFEHKEEDKHAHYLRREFAYTNFEQKYTLPDNVDEAKISAKVEDGILTIDLPKIKREEGKTGRQIAIS